MKFTLSWLKEHLDTAASLDDVVDALTRIGLKSRASKTLAPSSLSSAWRRY